MPKCRFYLSTCTFGNFFYKPLMQFLGRPSVFFNFAVFKWACGCKMTQASCNCGNTQGIKGRVLTEEIDLLLCGIRCETGSHIAFLILVYLRDNLTATKTIFLTRIAPEMSCQQQWMVPHDNKEVGAFLAVWLCKGTSLWGHSGWLLWSFLIVTWLPFEKKGAE